MIALQYSKQLTPHLLRCLRTPSKGVVSEATVASYLRKNIFRIMAKHRHLSITRIINEKQHMPELYGESQAS